MENETDSRKSSIGFRLFILLIVCLVVSAPFVIPCGLKVMYYKDVAEELKQEADWFIEKRDKYLTGGGKAIGKRIKKNPGFYAKLGKEVIEHLDVVEVILNRVKDEKKLEVKFNPAVVYKPLAAIEKTLKGLNKGLKQCRSKKAKFVKLFTGKYKGVCSVAYQLKKRVKALGALIREFVDAKAEGLSNCNCINFFKEDPRVDLLNAWAELGAFGDESLTDEITENQKPFVNLGYLKETTGVWDKPTRKALCEILSAVFINDMGKERKLSKAEEKYLYKQLQHMGFLTVGSKDHAEFIWAKKYLQDMITAVFDLDENDDDNEEDDGEPVAWHSWGKDCKTPISEAIMESADEPFAVDENFDCSQ